MDIILKELKELCPWATEYVEIEFIHHPRNESKTYATHSKYLTNGEKTLYLDSLLYHTIAVPAKIETTPYNSCLDVKKRTKSYNL